jgi:hypothetical protein
MQTWEETPLQEHPILSMTSRDSHNRCYIILKYNNRDDSTVLGSNRASNLRLNRESFVDASSLFTEIQHCISNIEFDIIVDNILTTIMNTYRHEEIYAFFGLLAKQPSIIPSSYVSIDHLLRYLQITDDTLIKFYHFVGSPCNDITQQYLETLVLCMSPTGIVTLYDDIPVHLFVAWCIQNKNARLKFSPNVKFRSDIATRIKTLPKCIVQNIHCVTCYIVDDFFQIAAPDDQ